MNRKLKFAIPIIAGVLVLSTGVGVLAATSNNPNTANQPTGNYQTVATGIVSGNTIGQYCGGATGMMGFGTSFITPQVAALLGTTVTDLESQLTGGKTLADIAGAKGVSQEQLIQTIIAPYKDHLDLMVKYGYITQDHENTFLQQAQLRLQTLITSKLNSTDANGWGDMGGMMYGWSDSQDQSGTNAISGGNGMMNDWNYSQTTVGSMMGGYGGGMMGRR